MDGLYTNIWQAYLVDDGPNYAIGHTINLVAQCVVLGLALFGIAYCWYENRVRARGKRDYRLIGLTETEQRDLGYLHPKFRYIL